LIVNIDGFKGCSGKICVLDIEDHSEIKRSCGLLWENAEVECIRN